ncbi:AAA family ATPase [Amycolatopsis panacis]|uniref:Helix-turn-helix transcriptional regulator n=1 Tax=Amycolatopsis panacis TaxID=2340917 RepID=A0A419I1T2_9PSEU|nr:AAA family ATPase [Amycolatopsis panacis]RJQ83712.1 helix-turn-helix transcriptional regulator [Amycolatopsis panacis]
MEGGAGAVDRAAPAVASVSVPWPLTVFAGEPGSGRSTVLAGIAAAETGTVRTVRLTEADRECRYGALFRILSGLDPDRPGGGPQLRRVLATLIRLSAAGSPARPEETAWLASAVFAALRRRAPLLVLVDDVQWLDDATVALLEPISRLCLAHGQVRLAVTLRITGGFPEPGESPLAAVFERLRAQGRAGLRLIRPLPVSASQSLIAGLVSAHPDADLVRALHTASRGNPAALLELVHAYQAAGALRLIDRTAYRIAWAESSVVLGDHPLVGAVGEAGPGIRAVAAAMAVLAPAGPGAPALVAQALQQGERTVRRLLDRLAAARVLVPAAGGGRRFRVPAVRASLLGALGPFARRRYSAIAVEAIWAGTITVSGREFLLDSLVEAGALVDTERAAAELLEYGVPRMLAGEPRAERWLSAAAEWARRPEEKIRALVALGGTPPGYVRVGQAVGMVRRILRGQVRGLPAGVLHSLSVVYLIWLASAGEEQELRQIAESACPPLPGGAAQEIVNRALALMALGRWGEGGRLLRDKAAIWHRGDPITADFGEVFLTAADVVVGVPARLREWLAHDGPRFTARRSQYWLEHHRFEINMLLLLGERESAVDRMAGSGITADQLSGPDRFLLHYLAGDWPEAMRIAHRALLERRSAARPLPGVLMVGGAIRILAAQGRLRRAQDLAADGRDLQLPHVIDHAEFTVAAKLGEDQRADELLLAAAATADEHGYLLGTEELWPELARSAVRRGKPAEAAHWAARSAATAWKLDTVRAHLQHFLARAVVFEDVEAARRAVELAGEYRAGRYESAMAFFHAGLAGHDTERSLGAGYELFGELGAWFWRARVRKAARARGIVLAGRAETTAENERLLAILVAEGLSNRRLATVLGTSEKSVEGQLSRMFSRIGYRSRVELAAAMLTGEYQS